MSVEAGERFIAWLRASGGFFHPDLQLKSAALAPDSSLISCPFELAITTATARAALAQLYPNADERVYTGWSERMLVAVYVILHWVHAPAGESNGASESNANGTSSQAAKTLRHQPYIDVLPSRKDLRTPSYFSTAEKPLLRGTNLEGVVRDREAELRAEYERVKEVVPEAEWEQYLAATTYISSRAFPSRLLSLPPTNDQQADTTGPDEKDGKDEREDGSYPVLLPGLDLFNPLLTDLLVFELTADSRGQPITWLSSPMSRDTSDDTRSIQPTASSSTIPSVSFLNPKAIASNTEVYNNYGPKSNEELLLSYGFVIPANPDDTLILRLGSAGGPSASAAQSSGSTTSMAETSRRFALRRDGEVPVELLRLMRTLMGGESSDHTHGEGCGHDHDADEDEDDEDDHAAHEKEMEEMQLEMDVLGELGGMLEDKLEKLRAGQDANEAGGEDADADVREEVRRTVDIYRQGQIDIIEATQDKLSERIDRLEGLVDQGMGTCPCGC